MHVTKFGTFRLRGPENRVFDSNVPKKCEIRSLLFTNTSSFAKKKPVDFDDKLKIRDVRYDNMTKITIKVQLF